MTEEDSVGLWIWSEEYPVSYSLSTVCPDSGCVDGNWGSDDSWDGGAGDEDYWGDYDYDEGDEEWEEDSTWDDDQWDDDSWDDEDWDNYDDEEEDEDRDDWADWADYYGYGDDSGAINDNIQNPDGSYKQASGIADFV